VVEARCDARPDRRVGHRRAPPDEQVVEVEHPLRLLRGGIGGEQSLQRLGVLAAPRVRLGQDLGKAAPRVDDA
jgi:hypothetical protein